MLRFANAHIAYTRYSSTPSVAKFCSKILTLTVYNILHELCFIIPAAVESNKPMVLSDCVDNVAAMESATPRAVPDYVDNAVTAIQKALMSKKTEESNKYG